MNDKMYKSNIKPLLYSKIHLLLSMCVVLFIVCLYICVCECLFENNNHKTKHKNNTNSRSAFEPGASGLSLLKKKKNLSDKFKK